jgi:hypothetical protein
MARIRARRGLFGRHVAPNADRVRDDPRVAAEAAMALRDRWITTKFVPASTCGGEHGSRYTPY